MIGHIAVEPEPAEPSADQIEVDLFAEASLGADTKQYPTISIRISARIARWSSHRAVERR